MSKKFAKAEGYVTTLRKSKSKYTKEVPAKLAKIYGSKEKRPKPDYFRESSFLYIRSYDGDIGLRPFSGIQFWKSPDINISPLSNTAITTTELMAGQTYTIRCRLNNRGDLMIPYPKVEFFLTDPSLGFNTSVAELLGLTQLPGILLPASNNEVRFNYTVPASEAGHKCLFARTYSFSPLDKPFDLHALIPRIDRHIGQKNLNFVPQATPYSFNLVHQFNAMETIEFIPMSRNAVLALQHPGLRALKVTTLKTEEMLSAIKIRLTDRTSHKVSMKKRKAKHFITTSGKGFSLERQAAIHKKTDVILKGVQAGKGSHQKFKKQLNAFNELNRRVAVTKMQIQIPDFGTRKGYAVGFEIINRNTITGKIKGGITIVALGI